ERKNTALLCDKTLKGVAVKAGGGMAAIGAHAGNCAADATGRAGPTPEGPSGAMALPSVA
ncbi:hypothetical protein ACNRDG_19205, partial [Ralstonia pseudosolanacearum]